MAISVVASEGCEGLRFGYEAVKLKLDELLIHAHKTLVVLTQLWDIIAASVSAIAASLEIPLASTSCINVNVSR